MEGSVKFAVTQAIAAPDGTVWRVDRTATYLDATSPKADRADP